MSESDHHLAAVMAIELEALKTPGADILELYQHIAADHILDNGGRVLVTSGRDIQAEFGTPREAVRCAAAIQRRLAERNRKYPAEEMKAEIGIHLGSAGMSTAKRLRAGCRPAGVLVSEDIARACSDEGEFRFEPAAALGDPASPQYVRTFYLRPAGKDSPDEAMGPEEIRDAIMTEIKRAGRRIDGDWLRQKLPADNPDINKALNWLVDRGFLDERARRDGRSGYSAAAGAGRSAGPARSDSKYLRYKKKITRDAEKAGPGFRAHLTTFLSVNAGLVILNVLTSRQFPWVLFPIGGWGIGLFTHYVSTRVTAWKKRHTDALPDLDREQYGVLRKIHKAVEGFAGHASSNAAVAAFLLMTDLITGPGPLWSLIPITVMAVPVVVHWTSFRSRMRKLTARLKELVQTRPAGRSGDASQETDPSVIEALRLREAILRQVKSMGDRSRLLGDDVPSLLETHVSYIRLVAGKAYEIDRIISEIPVESLKADRHTLEKRMAETEESSLRDDYRRSIEEINSQLEGCRQLREQEEMVRGKIRSSLNSMKQLQLDVAKFAGASSLDSKEISSMEREIQEMSERLEDLQAGYDELDETV